MGLATCGKLKRGAGSRPDTSCPRNVLGENSDEMNLIATLVPDSTFPLAFTFSLATVEAPAALSSGAALGCRSMTLVISLASPLMFWYTWPTATAGTRATVSTSSALVYTSRQSPERGLVPNSRPCVGIGLGLSASSSSTSPCTRRASAAVALNPRFSPRHAPSSSAFSAARSSAVGAEAVVSTTTAARGSSVEVSEGALSSKNSESDIHLLDSEPERGPNLLLVFGLFKIESLNATAESRRIASHSKDNSCWHVAESFIFPPPSLIKKKTGPRPGCY
mmetsp:Transcript_16713/g.26422  ORF Transcript_16713/g.26422 Transcript_16713/m.26422 type:complete len:278 (+) Transcript_16713:375-1208(+)